MAAVPTPAIQTAGLAVPAATINSQGNLATYLAGRVESGGARRPLFIGRQTVAQSITASVVTAVTLDTEDVDYDNGHSTVTNTDRYTAQTAGYYLVSVTGSFVANATGERYFAIGKNGSPITATRAAPNPAASPTSHSLTTILLLASTEWVSLMVFQSTAGPLNTGSAFNTEAQCRMAVQWISV